MTLTVVPTDKPVGAEIRGVDIEAGVDQETFAAILAAINRHSMIVFRDQKLSHRRHVEFSRMLGPMRPMRKELNFVVTDYPDVFKLSNIRDENGDYIGIPEAGQYWHSDRSYADNPPAYAIIHAVEVPRDEDGGPLGDTQFVSTRHAYQTLPEDIRRVVDEGHAVHYFQNPYRSKQAAHKSEQDDVPPTRHPMVRAHPLTGDRFIYVNDQYTWKVEGMEEEKGRELIRHLVEHTTRGDLVYRHRWREGDLVIWDDRLVQHHAVSDYQLPQRRLLHRTTVQPHAPG